VNLGLVFVRRTLPQFAVAAKLKMQQLFDHLDGIWLFALPMPRLS
jgi:hypothetical protein